jgi:hypothetical protein
MDMPASLERRLGQIESDLEVTTPRLAMMFRIFTRLTAAEQPNGAERLPRPSRLSPDGWRSWAGWLSVAGWLPAAECLSAGWRRVMRRPEIVALAMFTAAVTAGVVFAVTAPPVSRQCPQAAASAQSQITPPTEYQAPAVSADPRCPLYILTK